MASVWRMMVSAAALCLLLASLSAAIDNYDDIPPGDMGFLYQEQNYIDPGLESSLPEMRDDGAMRSLMLYKMLTSMRNQAVSPNVLAGPNWESSGSDMVPPEMFGLSLKGSVMKRGSDAGGSVPKPKAAPKQISQTQKWKNKKGRRVGSQVICYFKLCAFRPPNYYA